MEEKKTKNITVLSIEQAATLPFLTYRFAQEGMRVIRLEHPTRGDPNRLVGQNDLHEEGMHSYYLPNNAGKEAITLNLMSKEGQEIFQNLIFNLNVDIFATNQLPRSYKKLGIDYKSLKTLREDIIWVGITGFGPTSNEAAYDPILQARAGFMHLTGEQDGDPMVFGIPVVDLLAAEHAYGEVMKALWKKSSIGKGTKVEISMFQSSVSWQHINILLTGMGYNLERKGNTHRFFSPVSVFPTNDGFVYLAIGNNRQWEAMTKLPGFESLQEPSYTKNEGRRSDIDNLLTKISDITRTKSTDVLLKLFQEIQVPIGRINSIDDVMEDKHIKDKLIRSLDPKTGTEVFLPPPPVISKFLYEEGLRMSFPPRQGEHNQEIYGKTLGLSKENLKILQESGVI